MAEGREQRRLPPVTMAILSSSRIPPASKHLRVVPRGILPDSPTTAVRGSILGSREVDMGARNLYVHRERAPPR